MPADSTVNRAGGRPCLTGIPAPAQRIEVGEPGGQVHAAVGLEFIEHPRAAERDALTQQLADCPDLPVTVTHAR
ncbi:hypothetical protein [Streptomyces sp. NPDC101776]|uniref:hypothetical protein n=1 Tax=Streptomyces sp. NPDC101776 TaxID=3366146 RepID=UPI0038178171